MSAKIDGNELWEWFFSNLNGKVPSALHDELLDELAAHINTHFAMTPTDNLEAGAGDLVAEWGYANTVGNLIAQLRTLPPEMPIHGAFHADYKGGRQAFIRGLTLSRERVNGRKIETGNENVPYSAVMWSAPEQDPTEAAAQLAAVTAERDAALALVNYAEDISKQLDARATAAEAQLKAAREALDAIADADEIDAILDPTRLIRIAGAARRTALSLDTNKGDGV